jgi:predicted  nucleic acid-binding Zn-ribbon protein
MPAQQIPALTKPGAADTMTPHCMLEVIEKLLVLQDRDRRLSRLRMELERIPAERKEALAKAEMAQKALEQARLQVKTLESERKRLELEVEAKNELIQRYQTQQFQTRKNEEFKALGHEIELNKKLKFDLENQVLDLMEKIEAAQKQVEAATRAAAEAKKLTDELVAQLNQREANLKKDFDAVTAERATLAAAVDSAALYRYERLLKARGDNVIVGIDHGVCGGCHMRVSRQTVVDCRAAQEIVTCLNCGRILYYSPEMDVSVTD